MKMERIYNRSKKYEVISFDIFDTLIKRNVPEPSSIFEIVQETYNARNTDKIVGFREIRMEAERSARASLDDNLEEICIEDIYLKMNLGRDLREKLCNIELELELEYCEPNIPIVKEFNLCVKNGNKVVLTSDMYLSKHTILAILEKCGISGYKKLYLSSDIGLQKAKGSLYEYILKDLKIEASNLIHFGDGWITDYYIPIKKGIRAVHINRKITNTNFLTSKQIYTTKTDLYMFINNKLPFYSMCSNAFQWGYETFGSIIYMYCVWVHGIYKNKKLNQLYFLARDMYLFVDVYQLLYPDDDITYLEISRKSLRIEYIKKNNDFFSILDTIGRKDYTLKDLLAVIGWNADTEKNIIVQLMKYINKKVTEILDDTEVRENVNEIVMPYINTLEDNSYKYLFDKGLFNESKYGIVDIGWHCTIQNMIEKICNRKVTGIYFGNTRRASFSTMEAYGFWFDKDDENDALHYMAAVGILEVMLFPHIGTTLEYKIVDNEAIPVYAQAEMTDYSFIDDFQKGAKQFVTDYYKKIHWTGSVTHEMATAMFETLLYKPTFYQAQKISELNYEDGRTYRLSEIKPQYKYIINPKEMIRDYTNSKWKEGFIKQLFPFIQNPGAVDKFIKYRNKFR